MAIEILKAIVLGLVQGLTEWLPISSTAHLLIVDRFLHLSLSDEAQKLFLVLIQLGSILAVLILYFKTLWPIGKTRVETKRNLNLWGKIIVGCIPAGIVGLLLDSFMEKFETWYVIAFTLCVYGVLYIIIEAKFKKEKTRVEIESVENVSYLKAFEVGLFQALAIIPGTSRSGSTILGGLLLGFSREVAAKLSFFMAIPVMAGASLLRFFKYFKYINSSEWVIIIIGMAVSFAVSIVALKGLISYVRRHDFTAFGIYRIVLALLIVIFGTFN